MSEPVITVDGSSGSGKTTLGRRLAAVFELPFVDTGPVYRGVMVAAVRAGVGPGDQQRLIELARRTDIVLNTDPFADSWHVKVDGIDAGALLRDPAHATLLSTISQIPEVRTALLPLQRRAAAGGGVVVGRDCGTVVFPDAVVKFYLEAPPDVRVERRREQLRQAGSVVDFATVINDVRGRDQRDAPSMQPASDAHVIDTSVMDADAVFAHAVGICAAAGIA